jgi:hypothetical protein
VTDSGTTTETPTSDWASQDIALGMRDIIAAIADSRVELLRPTPSYAIVQTINRELRSATVLHVGDSEAVTVAMASIEPADIGQTVRIGGLIGHRYIEDVLGDAVVSGMYPASMGPRAAPYTHDARFGHALGSGYHGFIAHSGGDMSVSTRPGGALYIASDGSGTYAFIKANDHYLSPWWMGASPAHGIAALQLWGADSSTGYNMLAGYGNTYINATPAGSIALRVGNAEKVNISSTYATIYPTISCNAISCASINTNGYGISTGGGAIQANGGPIYGGGIDIGAGGLTCGPIYAGSSQVSCGVLAASSQVVCGQHWADANPGGAWYQAQIVAYNSPNGQSGARLAMHASAGAQWRINYELGSTIAAMDSSGGGTVQVLAYNLALASALAVKKDVRSLRPERERIFVHRDPESDVVEQPDIMALRPTVYRSRRLMQLGDEDHPDGTPLGRETRRERMGLIADEVQHVIPSAVMHDHEGEVVGIFYDQITVALLDHVQELTRTVETLRYRVTELEGVQS